MTKDTGTNGREKRRYFWIPSCIPTYIHTYDTSINEFLDYEIHIKI